MFEQVREWLGDFGEILHMTALGLVKTNKWSDLLCSLNLPPRWLRPFGVQSDAITADDKPEA